MFDRDQQWDRNWRRLEAMARRGFRGLSEFASADWSAGLGDNFRIGRMLASGDLRLVALFLIENALYRLDEQRARKWWQRRR